MVNFEFARKHTMYSFTTVAEVVSEPELCYVDDKECVVVDVCFVTNGRKEHITAIVPVSYDCVRCWLCQVQLIKNGPWCLRISNRAPSIGDIIEVTVHVLSNGHVWIVPWAGMSCDFIDDVRFMLAIYENDVCHRKQARIDNIRASQCLMHPRSAEDYVEVRRL